MTTRSGRTTGVVVRGIEESEFDAVVDTMSLVFGSERNEEQRARFRRIFELERARCAFADRQMVGTAGAFSLELTVPGGSVACGGTTFVSVLPSHRRRGVLRMLIESHLEDVRDRGEPIAALWASESSIYGRFGFGQASERIDITIPRSHVDLHRLVPPPAEVRLVDLGKAKTLLPKLYDSARRHWPGFLARSETWWEVRYFHDSPDHREGASPYRYAVAYLGGKPAGYAQYRFKPDWSGDHGSGKVIVTELVSVQPGPTAGLWGYLLNHDLCKEIVAEGRSSSDPVIDLLAAPRRAIRQPGDGIWVRLVDIPTALAARRYSADAGLTIEVTNPDRVRAGKVRLEVEDGRASCAKTTRRADVTLDLEDLGACYLGRSRFAELAAAGRVAGSAEMLRRADAMFTWQPQPWCPEIF